MRHKYQEPNFRVLRCGSRRVKFANLNVKAKIMLLGNKLVTLMQSSHSVNFSGDKTRSFRAKFYYTLLHTTHLQPLKSDRKCSKTRQKHPKQTAIEKASCIYAKWAKSAKQTTHAYSNKRYFDAAKAKSKFKSATSSDKASSNFRKTLSQSAFRAVRY